MRPLVTTSLVLYLMSASPCEAYETDQFSNRLEPISDSTQVLDEKVNETIADVAAKWRGPRNNWEFVDQVFFRIGGYSWVDKIEKWAMKSPEIERLPTPRRDSIYEGHPFWATRVVSLFGVGPTIKLNQQLIGSDKLGHFLSQGRKFYRRYLVSRDEAQAAKQSAFTERAIFGKPFTGVYSNADLVANYEGYRFYRSLFDDNIIPGKPAILAWNEDHWVIQRKFTWADHVNAYWDEALNINYYDRLLYPYMKVRLQTFCPDYAAAPDAFSIENEDILQQRYAHLQMRDTTDLRLENLCVETFEDTGDRVTEVAGPRN